MTYPKLRLVLGLFLIFYFVAGLWSRRFPKEEIYPFFSWSLFDRMPNLQITHTIRIFRYADQTFVPPKYFADAASMFSDTDNSLSRYNVIIQDLGENLEQHASVSAAANRKRLEEHFLKQPVEYEVLKVEYNPIEYWKERKVKHLKILGHFVSGEFP